MTVTTFLIIVFSALLCGGAIWIMYRRLNRQAGIPGLLDVPDNTPIVPPDVLAKMKDGLAGIANGAAITDLATAFANMGAAAVNAASIIKSSPLYAIKLSKPLWTAALEYNLGDLWAGVYWNYYEPEAEESEDSSVLDIYICIVPCIPLHIRRTRKYEMVPTLQSVNSTVQCIDCGKLAAEHPAATAYTITTDTNGTVIDKTPIQKCYGRY